MDERSSVILLIRQELYARGHNTTTPDNTDQLLPCRDEVTERPVTTLNRILYFILTQLMAYSLYSKVQWLPDKAILLLKGSTDCRTYVERLRGALLKFTWTSNLHDVYASTAVVHTPPDADVSQLSICRRITGMQVCIRTEFRFCIVMFCLHECPT